MLRKLKYYIGQITLLFVLVVGVKMVCSAAAVNVASLRAPRGQPAEATIPNSMLQPSQTNCIRYLDIVTRLMALQGSAEGKLAWIDANIHCLPKQRQQLFTRWRANALAELNRHQEACQILLDIRDSVELSRQAQLMYDRHDFANLAFYLGCVDRLVSNGTWVSPYSIAVLHQRLAVHYEERGDVEQAVVHYQRAAEWYPVIWADPYDALARLLSKQGKRHDAAQMLEDALSKSTDAYASFRLWVVRGQLAEEDGDFLEAYCAYSQAAEIVNSVPSNLAPETLHQNIATTIDRLKAQRDIQSDLCTVSPSN